MTRLMTKLSFPFVGLIWKYVYIFIKVFAAFSVKHVTFCRNLWPSLNVSSSNCFSKVAKDFVIILLNEGCKKKAGIEWVAASANFNWEKIFYCPRPVLQHIGSIAHLNVIFNFQTSFCILINQPFLPKNKI